MKVKNYKDVESVGNLLKEEIVTIDLSECDIKDRVRVLDFISGLTFYNGSIKKLDKDNFEVSL